MNLFPSCYVFLIKSKNTKKINRTSSDHMDEENQNRHRKEGIEEGEELSPHLAHLRFLFYYRLAL